MIRQIHFEMPPAPAIEDFCKKWHISELAVFGSALTDHFGPDSDVDLLVSFQEPLHWSLFDLVEMEDELGVIFQLPVDLVTKNSIEQSKNQNRKKEILQSARTIYVAR